MSLSFEQSEFQVGLEPLNYRISSLKPPEHHFTAQFLPSFGTKMTRTSNKIRFGFKINVIDVK